MMVWGRGYRALRDGHCSYARSPVATVQRCFTCHRVAFWAARVKYPHSGSTHVFAVEHVTKAIVLISLLSAGLKMRVLFGLTERTAPAVFVAGASCKIMRSAKTSLETFAEAQPARLLA